MPRTSQTESPFEIRDPVHGFIPLDETERKVLDSRPMQRLKHIHQLAMTYQVYPGATHKRFEHSLGVMELAGRAYDGLLGNAYSRSGGLTPSRDREETDYWRKVVRIAALCHDLGHLPFSHASEALLPEGWNHEQLSRQLIHCDELQTIWETVRPKLDADDIAKIALGAKEYAENPDVFDGGNLTDWESLLSQIVTSDLLGVDRMDYLLRDSHHLGVAYGKFDHDRLIRMLTVVPAAHGSGVLTIGVDEGGMHAAEALLNARYFMFMQVYYHRARVAYDYHLERFLQSWLPSGRFAVDLDAHQKLTDNEVTAALARNSDDVDAFGHRHAYAIVRRSLFKELSFERINREDPRSEAISELETLATERYGDEVCALSRPLRFVASGASVQRRDGSTTSFDTFSDMAPDRLDTDLRFIFINPDLQDDAQTWVKEEKLRLGLT